MHTEFGRNSKKKNQKNKSFKSINELIDKLIF